MPESFRQQIISFMVVPNNTKHRLNHRDEVLRILASYPNFSQYHESARAQQIHKEWQRYLATHWPHEKHLSMLPSEMELLRHRLHHLSRLNLGACLSVRQIINIINNLRSSS